MLLHICCFRCLLSFFACLFFCLFIATSYLFILAVCFCSLLIYINIFNIVVYCCHVIAVCSLLFVACFVYSPCLLEHGITLLSSDRSALSLLQLPQGKAGIMLQTRSAHIFCVLAHTVDGNI